MANDPKRNQQQVAKHHSRNIDDTYIFDPVAGIYKPKTEVTEEERARQQAGTNRRARFFTDPKTDWRPIRITVTLSALTVILLWYTVHYARLQWIEMRETAIAAKDSARHAGEAVGQAHEQFLSSIRPRIWFTANGLGDPQYFPTPNKSPQTGQVFWTFHYTASNGIAYNVTSLDHSMKLGKTGQWHKSFGFKGKEGRISTPLIIGQDDFNTVVSDPGVTPEKFKELYETDEGISIRIVVGYEDSVGTPYQTSMCITKLKLGAIQYCEGSYIK
jgi:hypothetical protein